jgi:hypothetical protein
MRSALSRALLAAIAVGLLAPASLAVTEPQAVQSGMGREDTGAPSLDLTTPTPFQQFVNRLRLDTKSQVQAAQEVFSEALKEASPVGQEMLQLRQQLVNLALANKRDEMKPVVDAYAAAAARMTGIEARAFAKVYATLKPNQQSGAPEAFVIMAGMFQPSAPRGGGGRSGQRGGGER